MSDELMARLRQLLDDVRHGMCPRRPAAKAPHGQTMPRQCGACVACRANALLVEIDGAKPGPRNATQSCGLCGWSESVPWGPGAQEYMQDSFAAHEVALHAKPGQQHRNTTPGCPTCGMQHQVHGCGDGKCGAP